MDGKRISTQQTFLKEVDLGRMETNEGSNNCSLKWTAPDYVIAEDILKITFIFKQPLETWPE